MTLTGDVLMRHGGVLVVVGLLLWLVPEAHGGQRPGQTSRKAWHPPATGAPPRLVQELAALLDSGELDSAKVRVQDALNQYPSDAALHNIAGAIDAQQGAYLLAERHFRAAIRAEPRSAPAYLNLGRLYQEHAKEDPAAPQKALTVYGELLRVHPENDEARFQSAYLFASAGEWAASRALIDRLADAGRSTPQALAVLAVDLAGLADQTRAAQVATELLIHPDLAEEDITAVLPALERARADGLAERLLTGLAERGLASAHSLRQLGLIGLRAGQLGMAREVLERAMRSAGAPSAATLVDLARVAYKQTDFQGALAYLAQARDLDPGNAQIHFFFGIICVELNLGAEAYDALKQAASLAPENPYVNYALGAAAMHRRDPSEALPYFEKYVRLKPDDSRGRFALGAARFYTNEFDAARTDLQQAARVPETAAGAHYFLGRIARQLNQLDTAREEILEALRVNPQYADALAELGLLQTRSAEYAAAERSLAKALENDPDNYAATFNLAALYARTKDPRREEQTARLEQMQQKRAVAAQEFLRIIQVVPYDENVPGFSRR
jgi:tetratricopeptide (TPR) repeat protein